MRIALFYHSLVSDWNHGNAHFLRGIASELQARGHVVRIFEPVDGWSRMNLVREHGQEAVDRFHRAFPKLRSVSYEMVSFDFERALAGVDLAIVHEWNDPRVVSAIGERRRANANIRVLFHDTHHRALSAEQEIARFELANYDGVLAYGESLKERYVRNGWGKQVHVWHEAADTRTFYPRESEGKVGDVVWIGNWGDEERTEELREFFVRPVKETSIRARVHGVRYPKEAVRELADAGIAYGGWLPNFEVPSAFARFKATVHVPRRPYIQELSGIPTIRPFEALACGIPLVSAPWRDTEGLFRVDRDFLMARDGHEMRGCLQAVLQDRSLANELARSGLETITTRHTCAHRADELFRIYDRIKPASMDQSAELAMRVRQ
ncbi:MAG: glycosyltransferase [Acidobacteriaceae bacterium]|nr:glycosyltransferase [Acidobacteriaceae bacterium]MBV9500093.1 glycosyltransferase [Acidobacteriaceae bacterium]